MKFNGWYFQVSFALKKWKTCKDQIIKKFILLLLELGTFDLNKIIGDFSFFKIFLKKDSYTHFFI